MGNNQTSSDKYFIQLNEIEMKIDKIKCNKQKAASSVEGIVDNKITSILCCCCTACNLNNDYQLLEDNEIILNEVDNDIIQLRRILDEQSRNIENEENKINIEKKNKEYDRIYKEYTQLKIDDIQIKINSQE